MESAKKVFVSSRMKELSEERATVEEAVSELWTHENLPFVLEIFYELDIFLVSHRSM
jgi:hypothetical protein